jgi:acyl-CoA thioesterase-1
MPWFQLRYVFFLFISLQVAASGQMLILGDSLTEGYGVGESKAYPQVLEQKLKQAKKEVKVIASAISGSTTATGPDRFAWISKRPDVMEHLVLFLGGNDVLRSIDPAVSKMNLKKTLQAMKTYQVKNAKSKVKIYLVEMKVPSNYGASIIKAWQKLYIDLKKDKELDFILIPFPLAKIALKKELNLADGIHPNEKGHELLAEYFFQFFTKAGYL